MGVVSMSVVTDLLDKQGLPFEVIPHEQAYTSIAEAMTLGISADEVLKALVLATPSGHALAVLSGSRRLDIRSVEKALGAKHVRLATEEEIELELPRLRARSDAAARVPVRHPDVPTCSTIRSCSRLARRRNP